MSSAPENLMIGLRQAFDPLVPDEQDRLRSKYYDASLIALNHIYESLSTYPYDEFIYNQSDSNTISSPLAPNGLKYELNDIKSLELLDITDMDKQIDILKTYDKYLDESTDWTTIAPLYLYLDGDKMTIPFEGEFYKFYMDTRIVKSKKIDRRYYDKIIMSIYKSIEEDGEYDKVATVALYYRSPSDYRQRYVTLYNEDGNEILDYGHLIEYNRDKGRDL